MIELFKLMNNKKLPFKTTKTFLLSMLYLLIVFIALLNASKGFSYDYQYYLVYIEEVKERDFRNLFNSLQGIYVPLKLSTGGVEVGFVILAKLFTYIFTTPTVTYAVIATASLYIKSRVLTFFRVKWYWIYLILTYSCILLEANALRSGISLTVFMLSIQCYFKNKYSLMLLLWIMAASLHLQAFYFVLCFLCVIVINLTNLIAKRWVISIITLFVLFTGMLLSKVFQAVTSEKLTIYALKESISGGFNLISVLSLSLMSIVFILIINSTRKAQLSLNIYKSFVGLMLISLSTLSIYIFFTNVAVVGDRLWQWGFVIFCMSYFGIHRRKSFTMSKVLLATCLIVNLINIIFRYPLTNLFYPILPYTDFSNI